MQHTAGKLLLVFVLFTQAVSCDNSKKEKKNKEKAGTDTMSNTIATPDTASSSIPATVCYRNEGLKYNTIISIASSGNTVSGSVAAGEIGSDRLQLVTFTGTQNGGQLEIQFNGTPPLVGDASEWTSKPWKIIKETGSERLLIPFKAKNYETNNWQEMEYEFTLTPCSN